MRDPAQVANDAQAAKEVLLERGWTQNTYEGEARTVDARWGRQKFAPGPVCALGALNVATGRPAMNAEALVEPRTTRHGELYAEVMAALGPPLTISTLIGWNDGVANSRDQVIAVFDKVVAKAIRDIPVPKPEPPLADLGTQADHELAGGPTP